MVKTSYKQITLIGIVIWLSMVMFYLYEFFLRTFVGSIANQIIKSFHLSPLSFSMMGAAYYLTFCLMQIPVGLIVHRHGVKNVAIFAVLICAVSTAVFSSTHSTSLAILCRIGMGFGSSFGFICLLVVMLNWFPKKYFSSITGLSQFLGTLGPLLAGGPLIYYLHGSGQSWRGVFMEIAAFGILLACTIAVFIQQKNENGMFKLVKLNVNRSEYSKILVLLKNKNIWSVSLYVAFLYAPIVVLGAVWGTFYLELRGFSQAHAATLISVMWLGFAIGCPIQGMLSEYMRRRNDLLIASALFGTLLLIMLLTNIAILMNTLGIIFFLVGLMISSHNNCYAIVTEHVKDEQRSIALGFTNSLVALFSIIAPLISGYLINFMMLRHHHLHATLSDILSGFLILPVYHVIALLIAVFLIDETYCKPQKDLIIMSPG